MTRRIAFSFGFVILLLLQQITPAAFGQSGTATNYYILRAPAASVPAILGNHSLTLVNPTDSHGLSLVMQSDSRTPAQVVVEVSADPAVTDIDYVRNADLPEVRAGSSMPSPATPSGALPDRTSVTYYGTSVWASYINQSAANIVHLGAAQNYATGAGIVAVIDTGVDPSQPALQGVLVPGYDFVHGTAGVASELTDLNPTTAAILNQSTAAILDKNTLVVLNQSTAAILDQSTAAILDVTQLPAAFGHGTMVAGIIHLVAPSAKIMPLKAFADDGTANLGNIIKAIYYAVDNGANVINMSFSLSDFSLELMKAVNYATGKGVICISSVGNDGNETYVYPAAFQNVLGVASTDPLDNKSSFSNYGAALARLAAPGEGILTLYPGGSYALVSGTSFSAAIVSGGALLFVQLDKDVDQCEADQAFANAKKLGKSLGYGRIDLLQAVQTFVQDRAPIKN